jgi:hypothetical protein
MRTGRTTISSAIWLLVTASMLVLAVACASEADGDRSAIDDSRVEDAGAAAGAAADDETTTTEAPTTTAAPTTTTTTLPVVKSGTYVVPDQFAPGTYRVEGYWARLDANQEIIDNDIVDSGLTLMTVAPSDAYVEINGAAIALGDLPQVDPIAEGWTDGTYLVGTDIAPGRYNVAPAGSSAYYARLDADLEIIDNDISEGNVIAIVDPGDWALSYTGTIAPMP